MRVRCPAFRQMSMPKPVCPNMATAPALGPPEAETAQRQHAGLLKLDAQPSAARIRFPEGAARKVSAWCGELAFRTPTRHRARTGNLEGS
jgi:hypothetical protein